MVALLLPLTCVVFPHVPFLGSRVRPQDTPKTRVAVLGGGFAGLTAARTLAAHRGIEVERE
jgi:NADPH-dependent 2,4-dienoyl-CoA reductase/sulfur reductase-like enzyme